MDPSDLTQELRCFLAGDQEAAERVFPLVYPRLVEIAERLLRSQSGDHTLPPEALVHESFLKIIGARDLTKPRDRQHFFSLSALAMRHVLVDYARARQRGKRPPAHRRLPNSVLESFLAKHEKIDLVVMDESLEQLAVADPIAVELVQLRFFAGLGAVLAAETLSLTRAKADRHWAFAQAFLRSRMEPPSAPALRP